MTGRLRRRVFARETPTVIGIETNDTHWPYLPPTWGNPHSYYTAPPASGIVGEEECLDATHPGPPFKTGGPFGLSRWKTESFSVKGSVDEIYWKFEKFPVCSRQQPKVSMIHGNQWAVILRVLALSPSPIIG